MDLKELQEKIRSLQVDLEAANAAKAEAEAKAKDGSAAEATKLQEATAKVAQLQTALDDAQKQVTKLAEEKDKEITALLHAAECRPLAEKQINRGGVAELAHQIAP